METLIHRPAAATCIYVLAHGAGAGMRHAFLETTAEQLAAQDIATLRYEFPYVRDGKRRPDPAAVLEATVREAVGLARAGAEDVPLIAGGKSMGGRMTSRAQAKDPLPGVKGLVFIGFPLHAPGREGTERAVHLDEIHVPMLFVQGTRDRLANTDLMKEVCAGLGRRATLHIIKDGDHSFNVLKRTGRERCEVMKEIASSIALWAARHIVA